MASPSQYRRNGRLAFIPGENPGDHYNYGKNGSAFASFCEGWDQARKTHVKEEAKKQEAEDNRDYRFKQLKEEIIALGHDARLHSILLDMLELLEEKPDGTATN